MAKKKGIKLPRVNRQRSLPVRNAWSLYKTLGVATVVAMVMWVVSGPDKTPETAPQAPAVVAPQ